MLNYVTEGKRYYRYDEIISEYPTSKKGCKTHAQYREKYNITDDLIMHAKLTDGKWFVSNGNNRKYDKLFIQVRFVRDNILIGEIIYDPLPEIITLTETELFRGPDGEALDIQVVGERNADGIYFNLKDVSVAFKMKGLCDVVTNKNNLIDYIIYNPLLLIKN